ncbi:glutathionylspermidine synthase family protein [Parachitinimonas caeni]|uniref:Glutathionylspermidine synthase family protein n=1 Tax=Parachitinimonas caeni TaxID=3031301 RepID=A0ABT7DUQ8_9NEIS|nr:glutathionylspermidine synthase family protein [Parachitinimonas caeni]MDK2122860.1 glutathionylspermidine synthase family protein [Parachitinimonas caeni]
MQRIKVPPRPGWQRKMESVGFHFHSIDGVYWRDELAYRFSSAQIDELDDVTAALNQLCLQAVEHVVREKRYRELAIPPHAIPLIEDSWRRQDPSLFGRFDLAYDGLSPPKLYEFNADTPTSLIESSIAQWFWLQDWNPQADQFNSLHEKLIERWKTLRQHWPDAHKLHLACLYDNEEDVGNLEYLADCASQAGWPIECLDIADVGWDGRQFVDNQEQAINLLFKLYPWEWLCAEAFGPDIPRAATGWVEPPWRMLLANKGILPILWQLNPGHPNLLECHFDASAFTGRPYVKKPLLSREGANISVVGMGPTVTTAGDYGEEGFVYQAFHSLPRFDDAYALVGSWLVGNEPAGIGIREDASAITQNTSHFVPHFFE